MSSLSGNNVSYYKTLNGLQSFSADAIYTGTIEADDGNFDNLQVNISSTLDGSTTIQNGLININTPNSLSINSIVAIDGSRNINMNSYAINGTTVCDSSRNLTNINSATISGNVTVDTTTFHVSAPFNKVEIGNPSGYGSSAILEVSNGIYVDDGVSYFGKSSLARNIYLDPTNGLSIGSAPIVGNAAIQTLESYSAYFGGILRTNSDVYLGNGPATNAILRVDDANDRVGINTDTPTQALDVNGNINCNSNLTITNNITCQSLTVDTNTLVVDNVSNKVGILDTTPSYELDVNGEISSTNGYLVGTTKFIDSSRALSNITSLSCSGNVNIDTNVLFVDTVNNRIGVNMTPLEALDVTGNIKSTALITSQNLNIDSGLLQTDSTNNYVLINNPTIVSGYNTQISGDTLITQGGLQINGFLNANSRDSIKTETMRAGIFYRVARLNTTASTTTQICVNVNRDTGAVAKDDNTYSAHNLQFNEDGSSNYQSHIGSGAISLINRYGVDTSGNFRLPDSTNTYRYPTISNSVDQLIQSGIETTDSSTGTITFGLAFSSSPVITATMVNSSTSNTLNCFVVTIHTVTTTSFQYVKKYVDFGTNTCGNAVTEDFHWIAIGTK